MITFRPNRVTSADIIDLFFLEYILISILILIFQKLLFASLDYDSLTLSKQKES